MASLMTILFVCIIEFVDCDLSRAGCVPVQVPVYVDSLFVSQLKTIDITVSFVL